VSGLRPIGVDRADLRRISRQGNLHHHWQCSACGHDWVIVRNSDHTRAYARAFASQSRSRCALNGAGAMHVLVRDNNVYQALRALKKKLQREGVFRDYDKPSAKATREKDEAARRALKLVRKQYGMG
jgi:ribosomal protein S21